QERHPRRAREGGAGEGPPPPAESRQPGALPEHLGRGEVMTSDFRAVHITPPATGADLDANDPLAPFAAEFAKPADTIYLDGNSLGLLCRPAEEKLRQALEAWRRWAVVGWTEGPEPWFDMSRRAAALLAPILGADAADVMVGQSTTVNLHQLL